MKKIFVLGIDAGGTHTNAVLLACNDGMNVAEHTQSLYRGAQLVAAAKVRTQHDNLPASVREVLCELAKTAPGTDFSAISRVTLGATLAVNALVQNRTDSVALALSAGPGLNPIRFSMGENVCVSPGGLDHRGMEVSPLQLSSLHSAVAGWLGKGVAAVACVGKFSPRNAAHELAMAETVRAAAPELPVVLGHRLSGQLNFPRRIATAYFNAAVQRLHNEFLDAVETALFEAGVKADVRLLKADGGAVSLALSRQEPVQSILSGPAASVMGALALCGEKASMKDGCALLLDMGGTTTDMALFINGSPVVDRDGMLLKGRRTLVRSLASVSIGVGGDSLLSVAGNAVQVGPLREGPALAFGGARATLLDALNVLNASQNREDLMAGDAVASSNGIGALAALYGFEPQTLAQMAVDNAMAQIAQAAQTLVNDVNARPIYTLAALKAAREAHPGQVWLVGGPSGCVRRFLAQTLGIPVETPPHAPIANAIGAALTLPTDSLDLYVDTGRGVLTVPTLALNERIGKGYSVDEASERACGLLRQRLAVAGVESPHVEVTSADMFATLDDMGRGSKYIQVECQAVPGIAASVG